MYFSDEEDTTDDDLKPRRKGKRKRPPHRMRCNWYYRDKANNEPCEVYEYGRGYCKKHYFMIFRRTTNFKCLHCDNDADNFGDKFCKNCGIKMGTRPMCKHEGCDDTIWSKTVKTEYCKQHDPKRKCHKKGCKTDATRERFGFYYCQHHYPERKICKHTTKGERCRAKWYSDIKDYGENGFCYKHNLSGIDRCAMSSNAKKLRKYSGRCCFIKNPDQVKKCTRLAGNSGYCSRHSI